MIKECMDYASLSGRQPTSGSKGATSLQSLVRGTGGDAREEEAISYHRLANFRSEERIEISLPVTLRTGWGGSVVTQASTVDLSARGMRLRANIPLRLGQGLLAIVSEDTEQAKTYRVVWVRQIDPGHSSYEAGLEVLTETSSAMAT
jgi:hypothetical protein